MQMVLKYFNAERWACSFGILLGIVSLAAAIYFYQANHLGIGFVKEK